jgi:hypothetical protein
VCVFFCLIVAHADADVTVAWRTASISAPQVFALTHEGYRDGSQVTAATWAIDVHTCICVCVYVIVYV